MRLQSKWIFRFLFSTFATQNGVHDRNNNNWFIHSCANVAIDEIIISNCNIKQTKFSQLPPTRVYRKSFGARHARARERERKKEETTIFSVTFYAVVMFAIARAINIQFLAVSFIVGRSQCQSNGEDAQEIRGMARFNWSANGRRCRWNNKPHRNCWNNFTFAVACEESQRALVARCASLCKCIRYIWHVFRLIDGRNAYHNSIVADWQRCRATVKGQTKKADLFFGRICIQLADRRGQ